DGGHSCPSSPLKAWVVQPRRVQIWPRPRTVLRGRGLFYGLLPNGHRAQFPPLGLFPCLPVTWEATASLVHSCEAQAEGGFFRDFLPGTCVGRAREWLNRCASGSLRPWMSWC